MVETTPHPAPRTRAEPRSPGACAVARPPGARSTAVVVGAGVCGLLAAIVLTDFYDRVVVVDRDAGRGLPTRGIGDVLPPVGPAQPMPALGTRMIEALVPGICADLVQRGARLGDVGRCVITCVGAHRLMGCDTGLDSVSASPWMLEDALRARVARAGVDIRAPLFALGLLVDDSGAVAGIRVTSCDDRGDHDIRADLVVDASGRASRSPIWLARAGWRAPPEHVQPLDLRCATRRFRLAAAKDPGWSTLVQIDRRRTAIAAHDRGLEWTVSLFAGGRQPPAPDEQGFASFAGTLRRPELAALLADMEPLGPGVCARALSNRWRRYDRLERLPQKLVVMGRALACLDPSLGLDTCVAVSHAARLRDCLRAGAQGPAPGRSERFFAAAARDLAPLWALSTPRPQRGPRGLRDLSDVAVIRAHALRFLSDAHLDAVCAAASRDVEMARAVLRVRHLLDPTSSLLAPQVLAGMLHDLPHRTSPAGEPAARPPASSRPERSTRPSSAESQECTFGHSRTPP